MTDLPMTERLFAFVLMPFESTFDDIYRLGIQAAAGELGMIASRVDEQVFHNEGILDRIRNQIEAADFIIADMTGKNPNVFYEVGYAHAKGKLCVLLTQRADDIPFDLQHHRHIVYGQSISSLKAKLVADLTVLKAELSARANPVSVELAKINGDLIRTKFSATAEVQIYLDLRNRTASGSPNIEAMYFFTGSDWSYTQDGQECPQTKGDVADYALCHLIRSPVPRLAKDSWAQVKLVGKKVLGYSWQGNELHDSYKLTGRSLVRVATERGAYDYPLNLDVEVSVFPF